MASRAFNARWGAPLERSFDLLLRIVARTNEHLHDVLERVLATPGIRRTSTVLALATPASSMHPSADAVANLSEMPST